jgi:hypothetical protein
MKGGCADARRAPLRGALELSMIDSVLRLEIESYAERLRGSSGLLKKARSGELSLAVVRTFLWNIRYVLAQTPRNLRLAQQAANERGYAELAAFYETKLAEESGHDRWAEQDLSRLDPQLDLTQEVAPLAPLCELMAFLRCMIARQPGEFLVYMLFVEYLTVLLGPEWLSTLERHCNVPATAMTSIGRHVELDKHHVEDDLRTIRELLPAETDASGLVHNLHAFMCFWERFYDELAELPN